MAHPEQRSGQGRLAGHGRRLHGRAPEREDQHHRDGERGVQGRDPDQPAGRRRARPVPVVGRRRPARPGRGRSRAGHHRRGLGVHRRSRRRARSSSTRSTASSTACRSTPAWSGFWYNKDLFAQAGIDAPPATWDELLEDVQTLKDAGITPIAVGAGDKWPAHFWYSYLMVRLGGADAMNQIAADNNFSVPDVIDAGEKVAELVALEPFQDGFLGAGWDAPDGESGTMASGGAAMDLMGQWAPGAFKNQAGLEPDRGPAVRARLVPVPERRGWRRCGHRCLRRRRRLRRRQGRPAGGGRLPQLHHQRREPAHLGDEQRAAGQHGGQRRRHRPEHAGRARGPEQRDVHAAVPRPVLHGRGRRRGQRPDAHCCSPGPTSPEDAAAAITAVAGG